jgi:dihydroflavonol-4-reductase
MAMKVFITGATGFIGTHLVRRLAQDEHELHCLVRRTSQIRTLEELGAVLITGDVTDMNSIRQGMQSCDWVMNLANIYSFWEPDNRGFGNVNIEGTRNVLECALEMGVSKVVHVSSVVVYGKPPECPFAEESQVGPVRFSEYARTKYEGELIAWELYEQRGLPLVVIYPGSVLGPGDNKATGQYHRNLIAGRMPARLFEDSVLTYVHVRDVVEVIVRAAEEADNIGEKYFACGQQLSMREINEMVCDIAGVPLPELAQPDRQVMANAALMTRLAEATKKPPLLGMSIDLVRTTKEGFMADGSKAERELGITYTPIRVALEEAIAWYRGGADAPPIA